MFAPVATKIDDSPSQITLGEATAVTAGATITITVTLLEFEHPFASVPVTVNVLEMDGLTEILAPTSPVLHTKLEAPLAVKVADAPKRICRDDAVILTGGKGFTNTVTDA